MVIGSVSTIAITMFVYALIFYIMTVIAKPALTFVKSFTVIIYSYFAVLLGELINTCILYIRGFDVITNPFGIIQTGINMLTTVDQAGATVYTFLSMINPFQIWFVLLLSIGLKVFADIKYVKSLIICIIFWLITTIYPVASVFFGEMVLKKAGMM
jgi:hypothetical protein